MYKHLRPYKRPRDYMGPDYYGFYPAFGRSRDSDTVEESNFHVALERLGGESETVLVIRDSHWAVGWVETLYIHESDENALTLADKMRDAIENYPLLDEEHHSELEYREAWEYWERSSLAQRIDICTRAGVSIFAARHTVPNDDSGMLFEYLREG